MAALVSATRGVVEQIKGVGFEVVKHEEIKYNPVRAPQAGLGKSDGIWPELLLWVYAKMPAAKARACIGDFVYIDTLGLVAGIYETEATLRVPELRINNHKPESLLYGILRTLLWSRRGY